MMSYLTAKLLEIYQVDGEIAGILDLPRSVWPEPGQYLPAQRHSAELKVLTTPLFRMLGEIDRLCVGPLPAEWTPGDMLDLLSPHGHGFQVPSFANRIGLAALGVSSSRLLPLIPTALENRASVALFCDTPLPIGLRNRIPSVVEIAPLTALYENLTWPDYLAMDLTLESLPRLREQFGTVSLPFEGQVLARTAMPCHGIGKCGVCSVKTGKGWRLACEEGPVFPLGEVLNVAG